jgi:hypothetical protein
MTRQTNMTVDGSDFGLPEGWRAALSDWAAGNECARELWLFGSRGPKGGAKASSNVDIGLVLMPKEGDDDWALGAYFSLRGVWRKDLEAIVGCHVSLEAMVDGNDGDREVRTTGVRLWQRKNPPA